MSEKESKVIPEMHSLEEMAEFWDTHSLEDYWDQTEPAEFEISPHARRRYIVSIDPDVIVRIRDVAHSRGISIESLVNLWLEQRLHEFEIRVSERSELSPQPA